MKKVTSVKGEFLISPEEIFGIIRGDLVEAGAVDRRFAFNKNNDLQILVDLNCLIFQISKSTRVNLFR